MSEANRQTRKRGIAIRATAGVVVALLLAWGCCDGLRIKLGRIADFLTGVIEISAEVSIEAFGSVTFDGDFAAWADIPAFSTDEIEVDVSTAAYSEGGASFDVDLDAAQEDIVLLAADDTALVAPVLFASWRGDKYTADKGVCYLGWVDASEVRLAATWCGEEVGVMYCSMAASGQGDPTCKSCETSSGTCAACDMDARMSACLPPKSGSGSIDIDVDIDIDIDVDNAETCGAP